MGIKNLSNFISKRTNNGVEEINISSLNGYKIAIDTSIFLYKFMYSSKFIDNFIQQIYHFKSFNIIPIYVFDGKPPKEKQQILDERKTLKDKNLIKIDELEKKLLNIVDNEEKKKLKKELFILKRKNINITKEDIINLKKVFNILGINYIQANCEADLICCQLYKTQKVNGCLSNDMDFLASGSGLLFTNYNLSNKLNKYNLSKILQELELTYDKFVDLCILCGCDYTTKIRGIGVEKAYIALKKYNNIETVIENMCGENKRFKCPSNFEYQIARKLLKNDNLENDTYDIINNFEIKNHNNFNEILPQNIDIIKEMTKYTRNLLVNKLIIICN